MASEVKAMAMQGSASEESYAQNSAVQNQNFHAIAKPRLEKAIAHLMASPAAAVSGRHLAIADLGCSYGRNTLDCACFILQALQQDTSEQVFAERQEMEVQYFFSDLPSNDFNALFRALQPYLYQSTMTSSTPKMYAAGVPGSFYGRLFPSASLDFVICSYSLHWLSQVPPSIIDKTSPSWNGGHAWIHKSTNDVLNAYILQARADVKSFITSRAYELKSGGVLFLFLASSSSLSKTECSVAQHDPIWEIFDLAWIEMVEEGIITLEEMEMFNMPLFFLKQEELEDILMEALEFQILHIETVEDTSKQENLTVQQWLAFLTSVTKPTVDIYLGKCKAAQLFDRTKSIAMRKENFNTRFTHSLMVASLERL